MAPLHARAACMRSAGRLRAHHPLADEDVHAFGELHIFNLALYDGD
jgi:hypothetical protein